MRKIIYSLAIVFVTSMALPVVAQNSKEAQTNTKKECVKSDCKDKTNCPKSKDCKKDSCTKAQNCDNSKKCTKSNDGKCSKDQKNCTKNKK